MSVETMLSLIRHERESENRARLVNVQSKTIGGSNVLIDSLAMRAIIQCTLAQRPVFQLAI